MKMLSLIAVIALVTSCTTNEVNEEASAKVASHELTITIPNVKNDQGKVSIAVFDKAGFLTTPVQGVELNAHAGSLTHTFTGLDTGAYAVMILHDENENRDMDFYDTGMPKEEWAASGKPLTGPPSFEQNRFELTGDTDLTLRMQ